MNRLRTSLAIVLTLPLLACSKGGDETVYRDDRRDVTPISTEDKAMNAAMQRARDSLDEYRRRLTNPPPTQTDLSLKARFEVDGHVEHMWISDVEITGTGFSGKLGNEPVYIRSLALGDAVYVPATNVSDWMAIDGHRLVGGHTLRVLRDRMSPDERRAFDAQLEFVVD